MRSFLKAYGPHRSLAFSKSLHPIVLVQPNLKKLKDKNKNKKMGCPFSNQPPKV